LKRFIILLMLVICSFVSIASAQTLKMTAVDTMSHATYIRRAVDMVKHPTLEYIAVTNSLTDYLTIINVTDWAFAYRSG